MKRFLVRTSQALALAAGLTAVGAVARADQCEALEPDQADRAVEMLREQPDIRLFCAPCGDKQARRVVVSSAEHVTRGEFDVVSITDERGNQQDLDLAYTYVAQKGKSGFSNLASLVGCPAIDVPIRIDR